MRKAHGSAALFALSQGLMFFSYAAIFRFGAWLIINRGLTFYDMFKYVSYFYCHYVCTVCLLLSCAILDFIIIINEFHRVAVLQKL